MNSNTINFDGFRTAILANPKVLDAYLQEKKNEELQLKLQQMKRNAKLTSKQLAEKLGISQPAISRLEKNAYKASLATLDRYAAACNTTLQLNLAYTEIAAKTL